MVQDPGKRPSEVSRLLFKAVKQLPEDEQAAVFAYFFERGIGIGAADPRAAERLQLAGLGTLFPTHRTIGPEQAMVPVRLSEAQHRRLKDWCAEHSFPMAVVIRGLIDRFLDSWERREG